MILANFSRPNDPIDAEKLSQQIGNELGKSVWVTVLPDDITVEGDISEGDRTAIQTVISDYVYIYPSSGGEGSAGPPGDSAYEVWLDLGNTGTEQDFIDSLEGPEGDPGPPGDTGPPGTTNWDGITNKPSTFTPSSHNHSISETTGLQAALDAKATSSHNHDSAYSPVNHTHTIANVTNLQTTLDGKSASNHSHTKADVGLGNVDNTSDSNKPISTAVQTALDAKSPTNHNHDTNYAPISHSHTRSQITDFAHTHAQADVTNLVSDLASKAPTSHNHDGTYAPVAHTHSGLPSYAVLANGTTAMGLGTTSTVKVTPTATATFTTTVPPAGTEAQIIILTSGVTSRTITFGTGFKPTATLATGTVTARVFVISWISDGTNLYETSRTIAMAA